MIELTTSSPGIKPLTKRKKATNERCISGVPRSNYRSAKLSRLKQEQIFALLENRQREREDYLLDETICYLLRERRDETFFVETLYLELNRRIRKLLQKFYTNFQNPADFEDLRQKVEMEIVEKILVSETNAGDYAQVNFGDFVITAAKTVWRGRLVEIKRENEMFETEREDAEADENRFVSEQISIEDKLILQSRLAELPENIRNAAVLHFLDGWQIESKDADAPTVSKFFGVSSRQIRNWLAQAREILSRQEGDKKQ